MILCYLQLIGGLADEKDRWIESVDKLEQIIDNIIGDVLISSANIAYLGPFTVSAFSVISVSRMSDFTRAECSLHFQGVKSTHSKNIECVVYALFYYFCCCKMLIIDYLSVI